MTQETRPNGGRRAIPSWPEEERPREKLSQSGPGGLGPTELLAILIRTGGSGGSTALDLARNVWETCGASWEGLDQADIAELSRIPGIGPAKAATIIAAMEIARRAATAPLQTGQTIDSGEAVFAHFHTRLERLKKEQFFALLLDGRGRLIREDQISEGTLSESLVHPREAYRAAVREAAAGVIFVHNHPSGDPAPSEADVALTRRLHEAGMVLGIRLLDHVIVARSGYFSFRDAAPNKGSAQNATFTPLA